MLTKKGCRTLGHMLACLDALQALPMLIGALTNPARGAALLGDYQYIPMPSTLEVPSLKALKRSKDAGDLLAVALDAGDDISAQASRFDLPPAVFPAALQVRQSVSATCVREHMMLILKRWSVGIQKALTTFSECWCRCS
jgi:hypothetical protein